MQSCYDAEEDAAHLLDHAEKMIFDLAEGRIRQGFVGIREIVKESFRTIDQLSQSKELVTGVPTGFVDLDEKTTGLQKGDLIIVAARPAMGKTSLCLNIAQYASKHSNETVGLFSLEMSKEQLVLRMLCSDARVDSHRLRTGNLNEKDWTRLAKAYADLSSSNIFIDDSATTTPLEMRAKCRRLKAEHGLGLVVLDYLQLASLGTRVENRQQEISTISRSLKGLAKELEVPVVALSQLSRAPEGRPEKRPQLSDLRESGAIEQDADIVMFIFREEEYKATDENRGVAEIIIGKQRNGPTGTIKLAFIKEFTRFENLEWRAGA
jgi:replicative DNA helicase